MECAIPTRCLDNILWNKAASVAVYAITLKQSQAVSNREWVKEYAKRIHPDVKITVFHSLPYFLGKTGTYHEHTVMVGKPFIKRFYLDGSLQFHKYSVTPPRGGCVLICQSMFFFSADQSWRDSSPHGFPVNMAPASLFPLSCHSSQAVATTENSPP